MTEAFWTHLKARRQVTLRRLVAPGPDASALQQIFEAAAQAPDHGRLRPWRFILIPAGLRAALGAVFAEALRARDPGCTDEACSAAYDKAFHAPCLVVAVLCDDPQAAVAVRSAEKLISLGAAIQNMLLAAQVLGLASGLASGAAMDSAPMRRLLRLDTHERAECFIGFGSAALVKPARLRPTPVEFVSSL